MTQPALTIGFIGVGHMGTPMIGRLAEAGFRVQAYDRDAAALEAVAAPPSVTAAKSAGEAVRAADLLLLMLPDSDAVEAVIGEVADSVDAATLVVDMGSSAPARTQRLAGRVAVHGFALVDAPVSGGVRGATAGTLAVMFGGSAAQFERCLPVFQALGGSIVHVGPVGSGHAVKAINNLLSATHLLSAVEGLALAERFGIDPATMVDVVNASSGRSGSTEAKLKQYVLSGAFDAGFKAELLLKDVGTALDLAATLGVRLPLSEQVLELWDRAVGELGRDADHTEIARWLSERQD